MENSESGFTIRQPLSLGGWRLPFPCSHLGERSSLSSYGHFLSRQTCGLPFLDVSLLPGSLLYLAWIRPKKDIVALTTPIYSFVFLAVPTDNFSVIILELLYAASLSILLLRLKYRFSAPPAIPDKEKLSGALKTYTERTHDILTGTPPDTAHQATCSFVQFANGGVC